jgi:hypothetical protein
VTHGGRTGHCGIGTGLKGHEQARHLTRAQGGVTPGDLVGVPEDTARKIAKAINYCTIRGRRAGVRLDRQ